MHEITLICFLCKGTTERIDVLLDFPEIMVKLSSVTVQFQGFGSSGSYDSEDYIGGNANFGLYRKLKKKTTAKPCEKQIWDGVSLMTGNVKTGRWQKSSSISSSQAELWASVLPCLAIAKTRAIERVVNRNVLKWKWLSVSFENNLSSI